MRKDVQNGFSKASPFPMTNDPILIILFIL